MMVTFLEFSSIWAYEGMLLSIINEKKLVILLITISIDLCYSNHREPWSARPRSSRGRPCCLVGRDMGVSYGRPNQRSSAPTAQCPDGPASPCIACSVTPRQVQILDLVANGSTAREVARKLQISVRTVEAHVAAARRRVGAMSVAELVGWAVATQVVTLRRLLPEEHLKNWESTQRAAPPSCSAIMDISEQDQDYPTTVSVDGGHAWHRGQASADAQTDTVTRANLGPKRGRPTVMTPERIALARGLLPSLTILEIARALEVSRGTLYAHMGIILGSPPATSAELVRFRRGRLQTDAQD